MSNPEAKSPSAKPLSDPLIDQVKSAVASLLVTATSAMEADVKALLSQNGAADAPPNKDLQALTTYALTLLRERLGTVLSAQSSSSQSAQSEKSTE